jgi:hypothetical protein
MPEGQLIEILQKILLDGAPPTLVTVQYAKIDNAAAAGQTQLVAAVAGKKIIVLGYRVTAHAAGNTFKLQDHNTDLMGFTDLAALGSTITEPINKYGYHQCAVGNELNINASAATQLSGWVAFVQV